MTVTNAPRTAETPAWYEAAVTRGGAWLGEPPPEPVNESELSWIWAGQRYPAGALGLVDGRALRVVNPGRPGGGAGPDFLDAVLEIDGITVRGDVELHVRASWFRAHGHDTDPAYDGVALHVVFRADEGALTRLCSGADAPVAAFAPWFDSRRDELQRWLGAEPLWREPCRDAVSRLGEDGVRTRLREAGMRRFEAKVAAMRSLAAEHGEAEAVWRATFDVTGVGGDREGFRRLAVAFPGRLARAVLTADGGGAETLTRALLHVAGLSAPPPGPLLVGGEGDRVFKETAGRDRQGSGREAPEGESALQEAANRDRALGVRRPGLDQGRFFAGGAGEFAAPLRPPLVSSGRPANRPERRLAGIVALYERADGDLPGFIRSTVREAVSAKALVTGWQVSIHGVALVGQDRARELALNVALPFTAMDASLRPRVEALLAGLGAAPAYGKTRFLESSLGAASGRRLVHGALEQQGLLAFLGEWCSRGGCGRCPLS